MKLKRFLSSFLACIMLICCFVTVVSAEDGVVLTVNESEKPTKFVEIFRLENGIGYFPIRQVFNNYNKDGYQVQVDPSMDLKNIRIAVVKTDLNTGVIVDRRVIFISWTDTSKKIAEDNTGIVYGNGALKKFTYTKVNDVLTSKTYQGAIPIQKPLIFSSVNDEQGGLRTFVSVDDFNNMLEYLFSNANYSITVK